MSITGSARADSLQRQSPTFAFCQPHTFSDLHFYFPPNVAAHLQGRSPEWWETLGGSLPDLPRVNTLLDPYSFQMLLPMQSTWKYATFVSHIPAEGIRNTTFINTEQNLCLAIMTWKKCHAPECLPGLYIIERGCFSATQGLRTERDKPEWTWGLVKPPPVISTTFTPLTIML